MTLSPHFSLTELSPACLPPPEAVASLQRLCIEVLEPVRAQLGVPLRVNSGYRSAAHNARIGGSPRSQHMRGEAADVVPVGVPVEVAMGLIAEVVDSLPVGQIIIYPSGFLHISIDTTRTPRRQMLRSGSARGSGGPYSLWVPE